MTAAATDAARARVIVTGRVQGVCFRAGTLETAMRLGLCGWVRNLKGGEVEGVFEGPRQVVELAVGWCQEGPPGARVEFCDVIWESPEGEGPFEIRYA